MYLVKLGDKEQLDSEQYFIHSEQPGISEQCCDDQKVSFYQVRLYYHSLIHGFEFCHQNHGPIATNCCGKVKNYAPEYMVVFDGGTIWKKRPSEPRF